MSMPVNTSTSTTAFCRITNWLNLLLFFGVLALSCQNKETDIGLDLRADGGAFNTISVSDFNIATYTLAEDSFATDSLSVYALGALNDPLFGLNQASIVSQIGLREFNFSFGAGAQIDSVVLALRYSSGAEVYGPNSVQKFNIYKLAEDLIAENKYYSNSPYSKGDLIGSWSGSFNTTDSVIIVEQNRTYNDPAQLRIRLSNSFGTELLNAPASVFTSNEAFFDYLKGLVIEPDASTLSNSEGGLSTFNLNSAFSRLTVYYNDSLLKNFEFSAPARKFNHYEQAERPSELEQQLNQSGSHFNKTFVQSLGGCKMKVDITNLLDFVPENKDVLINEAILRFYPEQSSISDNFGLPGRLNLFQPHPDDGRNQVILDYLDFLNPNVNFPVYGGVYSQEEEAYIFRFNRHLQEMIRRKRAGEEQVNRGFYVTLPADFPLFPGRVVFYTDTSSSGKMSLEVVYTELN